jgi:hypothetical protein
LRSVTNQYKIVVGHMQVSSQKDSSNPYHQNYHKALVVVVVPTCSCGLLLVGANWIKFFQLRYNCSITKSWSLPNTWHNATCVCSPCSSGHIQGPKLELALYFITFVHIIQHLGWPSTLSQVNTHWPPPKSLINSFLLPFYLYYIGSVSEKSGPIYSSVNGIANPILDFKVYTLKIVWQQFHQNQASKQGMQNI